MSTPTLGQFEPFTRHFGTEDGMPSNVVYDMLQDHEGFMWFCTDQGITRFDGHHFENFGTDDGLPDNEVLSMKEDPWGRIWLMCYNKEPAFIKGGDIYTSENSRLCKKIKEENIKYITCFYDSKNNFCLGGKKTVIINNEAIKQWNTKLVIEENSYTHCKLGQVDFLITYNGIFKLDGESIDTILMVEPGSIYNGKIVGSTADSDKIENIIIYQSRSNKYFISNYSFKLKKINYKKQLNYKVYSIVSGVGQNIYLLTDKGIKEVNIKTKTIKDAQLNKHMFISNRRYIDKANNIWYSSLDSGICVVFAGSVYNLINRSSEIKFLKRINNKLITVDINGNIGKIKRYKYNILYRNKVHLGTINDCSPISEDKWFFATSKGAYEYQYKYHIGKTYSQAEQKAVYVDNKRAVVGGTSAAKLIDLLTDGVTILSNLRTTSVAIDKRNDIWLGTNEGLFVLKKNGLLNVKINESNRNNRINSIISLSENRIALATHKNGVVILDGTKTFKLSMADGLANNNCISLKCSGHFLWVINRGGVDQIKIDSQHYAIKHFYALDALGDIRIYDLEVDGSDLIISSDKGILLFKNFDSENRNIDIPVRITKILASGDKIYDKIKLNTEYNKNNIQVSFTALAIDNSNNIVYKYILEGLQSDTSVTGSSTIVFNNIKSGSYILYLWAGHINANRWSKHPAKLEIHVDVPFWRKSSFETIILVALIDSIIQISLYFLSKIKRIYRKASQRKIRSLKLEMQALKAQVNPHFLFNALNSIQSYYAQNDEIKGNKYMSLFSQFMRKILRHSDAEWVILKDEIEMIETYIELENIRRSQPVKLFICNQASSSLEKMSIPTMLLQPYIENCIIHGFHVSNPISGPTINITFRSSNGMLIVTILDNGQGINKTIRSKDTANKSYGTKINHERIHILSKIYGRKFNVLMDDYSDMSISRSGTIVTISLPMIILK